MKLTKDPFIITVMIITLVMLTTAFTVQIKRYSKPVVAEQRLSPIVRLVKNGRTYCSGFIIDENTMITAGHCVMTETPFGAMLNPEAVEIRPKNGQAIGVTAKVKNVSGQLDRAILKGDFHLFAPLKYIDKVSDSVKIRVPGTPLLSCGYPMGGSFYCGKMTYLHEFGFHMAVKGIIIPGMSGGPTLSKDGVAVGLNDAVEADESIISPLYEIDINK